MMKKIAVFASGTGSNFEVIAKASQTNELPCEVSILIVDNPKALVIVKARKLKIKTFVFDPKCYSCKKGFETEIKDLLITLNIDLIVLAGYMRLIGPTLLNAYSRRIINIHPSLLPLYKGKDAVGQAMAAKAKETGVTVHYVDSGMDTGDIIEQVSLNIEGMLSRDEIETNIHQIEHKLYPKVIKRLLEEK